MKAKIFGNHYRTEGERREHMWGAQGRKESLGKFLPRTDHHFRQKRKKGEEPRGEKEKMTIIIVFICCTRSRVYGKSSARQLFHAWGKKGGEKKNGYGAIGRSSNQFGGQSTNRMSEGEISTVIFGTGWNLLTCGERRTEADSLPQRPESVSWDRPEARGGGRENEEN